jgi:hypothetical protein
VHEQGSRCITQAKFRVRQQWYALELDQTTVWHARAREGWVRNQRTKEETGELEAARIEQADARLKDCFWGLGSKRFPLSESSFESAVREALGLTEAFLRFGVAATHAQFCLDEPCPLRPNRVEWQLSREGSRRTTTCLGAERLPKSFTACG